MTCLFPFFFWNDNFCIKRYFSKEIVRFYSITRPNTLPSTFTERSKGIKKRRGDFGDSSPSRSLLPRFAPRSSASSHALNDVEDDMNFSSVRAGLYTDEKLEDYTTASLLLPRKESEYKKKKRSEKEGEKVKRKRGRKINGGKREKKERKAKEKIRKMQRKSSRLQDKREKLKFTSLHSPIYSSPKPLHSSKSLQSSTTFHSSHLFNTSPFLPPPFSTPSHSSTLNFSFPPFLLPSFTSFNSPSLQHQEGVNVETERREEFSFSNFHDPSSTLTFDLVLQNANLPNSSLTPPLPFFHSSASSCPLQKVREEEEEPNPNLILERQGLLSNYNSSNSSLHPYTGFILPLCYEEQVEDNRNFIHRGFDQILSSDLLQQQQRGEGEAEKEEREEREEDNFFLFSSSD